jgi:hypothetical protein
MDHVHPHFSNGRIEKFIMDWSKDGKNISKFDTTWMGLGMLTIPTKHFGWESITKTMKLVSQKELKLFCSKFEFLNLKINCL